MHNILFFVSFWDTPYNQAWPMELIRLHQEAGDAVRVVKCGSKLPVCHAYKTRKDLAGCVRCVSRAHYALDRVGVLPKDAFDIEPQPEADAFVIPDFADVDALKAFTVDGVNLGVGVASTVVSGLRDHRFDPRSHREAVELNVRSALHALYFFRRYLDTHDVDLVYVFNGRFSEMRPLVELCRQRDVPFRTFEGGHSEAHFQVYDDTLPHDVALNGRRIEEAWASAPDAAEREALAERWYRNRRGGVKQDHYPVFVAGQERDTLPAGFDAAKRNIALFNSSEDEFAALGEVWVNPFYSDQNDAIRDILARLGPETGVHFYLRVHPNLIGLDNAQMRGVAALDAPNLTVIPGESPIDTYALMDACDAVLTFGSTTGVEATFWGRPSVLYGRSYYESLGAVHKPDSLEELATTLLDPSLGPKPVEGALKFAYWFATRGEPVTTFADLYEGDEMWSNHDAVGSAYRAIWHALTRFRVPITRLPFYRRALAAAVERSRARFEASDAA